MWDAPFRQQLLDGLVELGYAVEHAFDGTPQVGAHTTQVTYVGPHLKGRARTVSIGGRRLMRIVSALRHR
jgi:hypothetical protein